VNESASAPGTAEALRGLARDVSLPGGASMPAFGVGTWRMGESRSRRAAEVSVLRRALDLGVRLVDTAEMYGDGGAEEVVGEAIAGRRDRVFLVSKVYPHHAGRRAAIDACERSLRRLGTDRIDLYLLHWRGSVPLAETVEAFERLEAQGSIRHWGVSNLDPSDLDELLSIEGGAACAANQVYYSLGRRGAEFDLLPRMRERGMPLMAYCPLDEGALARSAALADVGARIGASAAQVAIAWLLSRRGVVAIPKAARAEHLEQNVAAAGIELSERDLQAIDRAFPPPRSPTPLAIV
jgi:diketogulonate reductase-like aldo/keto reductase